MLANALRFTTCFACFAVATTFFLFGGAVLASPLLVEIDTVPDARQPRPDTISKISVIEFTGEITFESGSYFKNRFRAAKAAGCDLLIIDVDSPGGLKTESLDIAAMIRDCDWAYTVVFVKHEAISGGALISLGCDELHISPNAQFGDIGEIAFDPEQWAFRLIEPKVESFLSSEARALAESKGRSPELAESMVDKDVLVYTRKSEETGEAEFTTVRSDAKELPEAPWEAVPEAGAERFLTLNGARTKQLGIAQHFATTRKEVIDSFPGGAKSKVRVYSHKVSDTVAYILNYPFVTGLILVIGLVALYFEVAAPGTMVGGLIAGLCAALFFWSHFAGGTAGWMEVILFVAGLAFIAAELFVIPGFGVAGFGGIVLLTASEILASQGFVVPETAVDWDQFLGNIVMLVIAGFAFFIAAFFITSRMGSLPLFNRMVLSTEREGQAAPSTVEAPVNQPVEIGAVGVADSLLRPAGRASFNGRSFDVISDGSFVDAGTAVKVIKVFGNIITVAEVHES